MFNGMAEIKYPKLEMEDILIDNHRGFWYSYKTLNKQVVLAFFGLCCFLLGILTKHLGLGIVVASIFYIMTGYTAYKDKMFKARRVRLIHTGKRASELGVMFMLAGFVFALLGLFILYLETSHPR